MGVVKQILLKLARVEGSAVWMRISYRFYRAKYTLKCTSDLKLHLGCGTIFKEGYINIDHRRTLGTDMVCNIMRLPFPDNTVQRIESYHVIEHIPHPSVLGMLKEWHRVLKIGGELVIECPNFDETIREYMEGNEDRIFNIFGLQRFKGDAHLFGYNPKRLKKKLAEAGFTNMRMLEPLDYHKDSEPCMRMECRK